MPQSAWGVRTGALLTLAAAACSAGGGWTMDLKGAAIPRTPAVGSLGGKPFRVDRAAFDATVRTLKLQEGKQFIAERSFTIFLFLKDRARPDDKGWDIRPHYGSAPHIHRQGAARNAGILSSDYAMLLEFGRRQGKRLPGSIYLCLPDRDWVAGTFTADVE